MSFHDLDRLRSEMEELFSELWQGRRLAGARRAFRPAVDVYRTDDPPAVTVVCDLAGVDPADVELSVADGVLSITGVRRRQAAERVVYHQIELDHGPFERHVPIGEEAQAADAEAAFDRGLLVVTLPLRREPERPAAVPIRVVRRS
ncbi:MAG: Hsp20/alpha crystallin family protein [Thermoleophilia bacterium]|nr:Hsp20/alpha crystallin family protein [Thermoleophilia bacterium]